MQTIFGHVSRVLVRFAEMQEGVSLPILPYTTEDIMTPISRCAKSPLVMQSRVNMFCVGKMRHPHSSVANSMPYLTKCQHAP